VTGMSVLGGHGSGLGTIAQHFFLVGRLADAYRAAATHSFDSILVAGGLIPFAGMLLVFFACSQQRRYGTWIATAI
jgi:hypothetical protein